MEKEGLIALLGKCCLQRGGRAGLGGDGRDKGWENLEFYSWLLKDKMR